MTLAKALDQFLLNLWLRYEGSVAELFWNVFASGTGKDQNLTQPSQAPLDNRAKFKGNQDLVFDDKNATLCHWTFLRTPNNKSPCQFRAIRLVVEWRKWGTLAFAKERPRGFPRGLTHHSVTSLCYARSSLTNSKASD
jgi:hypothetical protein